MTEADRGDGFRQIALVGVAGALAMLTILAVRLASHDGDVSRWVRAGDVFAIERELPADMFQEQGLGYDGQFFYRIARAPLSTAERIDGIEFDRPAFRHQRLGYPLVAWALAGGGRQQAVPWTLPAVNVLAAGVASAAAADIARRHGRNPWVGVSAALLPGVLVASLFNLADAAEAAAVLAALALLGRRRFAAATVTMVAAVIIKETSLLLPIALLTSRLLTRVPLARRMRVADEDQVPWWAAVTPLAAYVLLQVTIASMWPDERSAAGRTSEHFSPTRALARLGELGGESAETTLSIVFLLALGIAGLVTLTNRRVGAPYERMALLGATLLPLSSSWSRAIAYYRHPSLWFALALVLLLSTEPTARRDRARLGVALIVASAVLAVGMLAPHPRADRSARDASSHPAPLATDAAAGS